MRKVGKVGRETHVGGFMRGYKGKPAVKAILAATNHLLAGDPVPDARLTSPMYVDRPQPFLEVRREFSGIFVFEKDGIRSGLEVYGLAGDAPNPSPTPSNCGRSLIRA